MSALRQRLAAAQRFVRDLFFENVEQQRQMAIAKYAIDAVQETGGRQRSQIAPVLAQSIRTELPLAAAKLGAKLGELEREPDAGEINDRFALPVNRDPYRPTSGLLALPNSDPHAQKLPSDPEHYAGEYSASEQHRDRDPVVWSSLEYRINALMGCEFQMKASDSADALALEIAAFTEAAIRKTDGWRQAFRDMDEDGIWLGIGPSELAWPKGSQPRPFDFVKPMPRQRGEHEGKSQAVTRAAQLPLAWEGRHPGWFLFGLDGQAKYKTEADTQEGTPCPDFQFIFHTPNKRHGNPYGVGAHRPLYWQCLMWADVIHWSMRFIENFAAPARVIYLKGGTSADEKTKAAAKKFVTSVFSNAGLVLSEGDKAELLSAMGAGTTAQIYEKLAEYQDKLKRLVILGQTLTSDHGDNGSRSLGEVHMEVFKSLIREDGARLAETINKTFVKWIVELNYGEEGRKRMPSLEFVTDEENLVELMEIAKVAVNELRMEVSKRWLYSRFNLKPPEDEDDVVGPAPPPPVIGPDGKPIPPAGGPGNDKNNNRNGERAGDTSPKKGGAGKASASASAALGAGSGPSYAQAALAQRDREHVPSPEIQRLYREGLDASLPLTARLRPLALKAVDKAVKAKARELSLGADEVIGGGLLDIREVEFSLPVRLRRQLVDQLNLTLTLAAIEGRSDYLAQARAMAEEDARAGHVQAAQRLFVKRMQLSLVQASAAEPIVNPVVELLLGERRIIPEEAVQTFLQKLGNAVDFQTFYQMDGLARAAAFTAWDITELIVRERIGFAMAVAADAGQGFEAFRKVLDSDLEARYEYGGKLHAWHAESIYDTNLTTAYSQALMDEAWELQDLLPYLQFANPSPQHPFCVAMAGKVFRVDDPIWRSATPPIHWHCGSSVLTLSEAGLRRYGLSVSSGLPLDETGRAIQPELYAGPRDRETGKPVGIEVPFGAWAPPTERQLHFYEELVRVREQQGAAA